ncbi:MAG: hypothetical protein QM831_28715 [Kofleriaceae bacterium]
MRALLLLALAGCYGPHPQAGSPCDDSHPCPAGLVCADDSTCELTTSSGVDDAALADVRLIDGCTPMPEICGDGIDQDCDGVDPPCPANDHADGAIDVGNGGTFMVDMTYATDDVGKPSNPQNNTPCGLDGGRDVFYKIHLPANEAVYVDTFGSNFDTIVRIYHGSCMEPSTPNSVVCHDNACQTKQTQYIWDLGAGDNCIVVDQNSSAETSGMMVMHVERAGRTGIALDTSQATGSVTGNTATASDQQTGTCAFAGNDIGYHFTECPGQSQTITATTCNAALTFDSALYAVQDNAKFGTELVCNDDAAGGCAANNLGASTITFQAKGAHPFWIIVDSGAAAAAGMFELDTMIQ